MKLAVSMLALTLTAAVCRAGDVDVVKTSSPAAAIQGGTIDYTVTVTNNSAPPKTLTGVQFSDNLDANLTLVPNSLHASPLAFADSYAAIGNTGLYVGVTPPVGEPAVTLTNTSALFVNDVAITDAITLVNFQATSAQGGSVTVNADGTFVYFPAAGFTGTDTFTYTIRNSIDATLADSGLVSIVVSNRVWYVNNAGTNGDGRSNSPFNTLTPVNGAGGAGDSDAASDVIYVFTGTGPYTSGLILENNQQLIGNGAALLVNAVTLRAAGSPPNITGAGITLASGNTLTGFNVGVVGTTATSGITGTNFGIASISNVSVNSAGSGLILATGTVAGTGLTGLTSSGGAQNVSLNAVDGTVTLGTGALSGSTGSTFVVDGGSATITYPGTITKTTTGNIVNIANRTAGNITLSGNLSGAGSTGIVVDAVTGGTIEFSGGTKALNTGAASAVNLTNNTGAVINFSNGGLVCITNSANAFNVTGGGTVTVTTGASINRLASSSGIALNVVNTTIGANKLTFTNISSTFGAPSGIVLSNTGASGNLVVTGDASANLGGNASGGIIQNTTGPGISLTNTLNPSFNNMRIRTTFRSGIKGTGVNGFSFTNGNIDESGLDISLNPTDSSVTGTDVSNIAFNNNALGNENNLSGVVTINNNILTDAWYHGIDIQNFAGTISDLTISNNSCTSTTSTASSKGSGIRVIAFGSISTSSTVTRASVSNNDVENFPSDSGIKISGGNAGGGPMAVLGDPANTANAFTITGNGVAGQSVANAMGSNGIETAMTGAGKARFVINANGNLSFPIRNFKGIGITCSGGNLATVVALITNNFIDGSANIFSSRGMAVGSQLGIGQNGVISASITGNTINNSMGQQMYVAVTNSGNTGNFVIRNNILGAPRDFDTPALRVDCGTSAGNVTMNLDLASNTATGSSGGGLGPAPGIGVRRQGSVAGVNTFNIVGLSPSPATQTQTEAYLSTQNPSSNLGSTSFSASGSPVRAFVISGSNFTTTAPFTVASLQQEESYAENRALEMSPVSLVAAAPLMALPTAGVQKVSADVTGENVRILSGAEAAAGHGTAGYGSPVAPRATGYITRALTRDELTPIIAAAQQRWTDANLTSEQLALLKKITFEVKSMPGWYLGANLPGKISIASNAGGYGWYVDNSPLDDSEFENLSGATRFYTSAHGLPAGHLDLLTTVMHEMGHQLGLKDSHQLADRDSLMYGTLTMGERRLPSKDLAKNAAPNTLATVEHMITPVVIGTLPPGKVVTFKFSVTVNTPVANGTTSISNTASIAGTNITGSPILSNTVTTPINIPPTLFTAATPPGFADLGFAYAGYTFVAGGNPSPNPVPTYALAPGSNPLPGGFTLSSTGVLAAPNPSALGTFSGIVVRASNVAGFLDTAAFTIVVNPALTIAPASLLAATAGTATSQTITVSNGTTPYASLTVTGFTPGTTGLTAGALVTNQAAGTVQLSGTPTAQGTANFTVTLTDAVGASISKLYTLTVNPAISIAPTTLIGATAGFATNQTITVSGGTTPYTNLSISGFNAGTTGFTAGSLTTNAGAGTVQFSGTSNTTGTLSFTVNVTDTAGATASRPYTVIVNPALSIAPTTLATAVVGQNTNQTITVSNGTTPYTVLSVSGFVAGGTGLTADNLTASPPAGTVVINGTPTAAGTATFNVNVTDTAGSTLSQSYSLNVVAITFTPTTLAPVTATANFTRTITINNAQLPLNSLTVSPFNGGTTGLTNAIFNPNLAAGTLSISGTATSGGTVNFTVNVTDANNASVSRPFSLSVNSALTFTPVILAAATAGTATNQTITVGDGTTPYTVLTISAFNAGSTGLTAGSLTTNLGAGTVALSGTATASGTATFSVNVTDTAGATESRIYALTVNAIPSIAPASLTPAVVGVNTNQTITVSNGTTPYSALTVTGFTAGGTGLTAANLTTNLGAGTVVLNGTPTAAGTANFTVTVTDANGSNVSKAYSLLVSAITVTPAVLAQATANTPYNRTLTVNNAQLPLLALTVSPFNAGGTGFSAGSFVPNLAAGTLAVVSINPPIAGTATFTVNVTDGNNANVSQNFTLIVNPSLVIAPSVLAQATAGTATNQTITVSNGTTPYTTLSVTNFDAGTTGLTAGALVPNLGAGTVVLNGTPTAAGTATFTVTVGDTAGSGMARNYSLSVNAAMAVTPTTPITILANAAANRTLRTVINGTKPYTNLSISAFNAGTTGLTAGAITTTLATGVVGINGTPTAAGTMTFTINATDSAGAVAQFPVTVQVDSITMTPAILPSATATSAFNSQISINSSAGPAMNAVTVSGFNGGTTGLTTAIFIANLSTGKLNLTGTAATPGTATFTVNATNSNNVIYSQNFSLIVNPALSIAPAALLQATAGMLTNQTITVTGGTTPYTTFSVSGFAQGGTGLVIGNISANAGAGTFVLNGTPTSAGTASFTVDVTDTAGAVITANYSVIVNAALAITPTTLAGATAGTATTQTLTVGNGTTPYTALTVTAFNAGTTGLTAAALTANPAAGTVVLSGTPPNAGTATFTVNVTDTAGATLSQNYSLAVNAVPTIKPTFLSDITAGTASTQTMTISDGTTPYALLSVSDFIASSTGLTAGSLTATAGTGTVVFNGTATATGVATFTVNLTDAAGATLTQNYTLTVNAALSIAPVTLIGATAGTATNQTLTISNGSTPYSSVTVNNFSAGTTGLTSAALTTTATTVVLNDTPTAAGTATFTVDVIDGAGATLSQNYTLTVNAMIAVLPATLPDGVANAAYSQTVSITGGTGAPTFALTAGALPAGLTLNSASGVISGTPTSVGAFSFTITATDTVGATGQLGFRVTIAPPVIAIAPPALPAAQVGIAFSAQVTGSGGTAPYTFAVTTGALPAGLTLSTAGLLSGNPTAGGLFAISITATDSSAGTGPYTGTASYSLTVAAPTILITPNTLPFTNVNVPYSQTVAATGGTAPYTFAITAGALPAGLTLSAAGVISGSATVEGPSSFTVTATDSSTGSGPFKAAKALTILVNSAPVIVSGPTATPNPAVAGQPVQFSAMSTDADSDPITYAWDFKDGSTSTLQSPVHPFTTPGTYVITLTVSDGRGGTKTGSVSLEVRSGVLGEGDADNDGFLDEIEAALGSNPFSSSSRPLGLQSPTQTGTFSLPNLRIHLDFAQTGKDKITLSGHMPVNGVYPVKQVMIVDIGGVVKTFEMNKNGNVRKGNDKMKMRIARTNGIPNSKHANFSLQLTGAFSKALADEKLTAEPVIDALRSVNVTIIFLNQTITATVPQTYTVRNSIGKTTTPK